jgi:predicted ribosomally synthesized peptide with nif11-like leader
LFALRDRFFATPAFVQVEQKAGQGFGGTDCSEKILKEKTTMANQAIDKFFNDVKADQALRNELEAAHTEDAFFMTAVRRGAERGYAFTVDEVRSASRGAQISSQLPESALASVAGGLMSSQPVTSWRFCTWTWLGC